MKKSRFTPEQMLQAIRQAESGTPVPEISRKLGITEATLYRWKKQYTGLDVFFYRGSASWLEGTGRLSGW